MNALRASVRKNTCVRACFDAQMKYVLMADSPQLCIINVKAKGKVHLSIGEAIKGKFHVKCGWCIKKSISLVYKCSKPSYGQLCKKCFNKPTLTNETDKPDKESPEHTSDDKIEQFSCAT